MGASGIETPLEHVAVKHHCTGQLAVALALLGRPGVHDQSTGCYLRRQFGGRHAVQPSPGLRQQLLHAARAALWCHGATVSPAVGRRHPPVS